MAIFNGTSGDDVFIGTADDDEFFGNDGNDTLIGGDGRDRFFGGAGDDVIDGGASFDYVEVSGGSDTLDGGSDGDSLSINYAESTLAGIVVDLRALWSGGVALIDTSTAVNFEYITGLDTTNGDDTVFIGDAIGNSIRVNLLDGNDVATGGSNRDRMFGNAGNDTLNGGANNDELYGGAGDDVIDGGDGSDYVQVDGGSDTLDGGGDEGDKLSIYYFFSSAGITIDLSAMWTGGVGLIDQSTAVSFDIIQDISGTQGNDIVTIGDYAGSRYTMRLNGGDDVAKGSNRAEFMYGDDGDDILLGLGAADRLYGDAGSDLLEGGVGNDLMDGGDGFDTVSYRGVSNAVQVSLAITIAQDTGDGTDTLLAIENLDGSNFGDVLIGDGAANLLNGVAGDDALLGGAGADALFGGVGEDTLDGGADADVLVGRTDRDTLTGGSGADRFVFRDGDTGATLTTADVITDFSQAEADRISLVSVDAIAGTVADDRFTFIGTAAFGGVAGQLRYETVGGFTYVHGDTNGDAVSDLVIWLDGVVPLAATDFAL